MLKNKTELITSLVSKDDVVLDIGFWGAYPPYEGDTWNHGLLLDNAKEVYGLDLVRDDETLKKLNRPLENYFEANAEDFSIDKKFDVIFAGDVIEHLSNPGLFLLRCHEHLKEDGKLILTTPNCFDFYNIMGKLVAFEPDVHPDHTCYFNIRTLKHMLRKNKMDLGSYDYIYTLGRFHDQSIKKHILNGLYKIVTLFTQKYCETLVVVAVKEK